MLVPIVLQNNIILQELIIHRPYLDCITSRIALLPHTTYFNFHIINSSQSGEFCRHLNLSHLLAPDDETYRHPTWSGLKQSDQKPYPKPFVFYAIFMTDFT